MLSLLWLIFTAIITNEICRACNTFMVATPSVDSLFADFTYMLSINRDALHWTNRANIIHGIRCRTLLWFLSEIKFKFTFSVSVVDVCCICQTALAHPRIQCIFSTHGEVSTWQVLPCAAAVTEVAVLLCRITDFILLQNYFTALRQLKNVPVSQQTWQYKWLVKQCNIADNIQTKFKFH